MSIFRMFLPPLAVRTAKPQPRYGRNGAFVVGASSNGYHQQPFPTTPPPSLREISLPRVREGGINVAVLSLLEPRPLHEKAFRELQKRGGGGGGGGGDRTENDSPPWWDEASRLREWYPASTNNLVVFLGLLGRLDNVFGVLQVRP